MTLGEIQGHLQQLVLSKSAPTPKQRAALKRAISACGLLKRLDRGLQSVKEKIDDSSHSHLRDVDGDGDPQRDP
jgi:hypothetical protein